MSGDAEAQLAYREVIDLTFGLTNSPGMTIDDDCLGENRLKKDV